MLSAVLDHVERADRALQLADEIVADRLCRCGSGPGTSLLPVLLERLGRVETVWLIASGPACW